MRDWFHPEYLYLLVKLAKVLGIPAAGGSGWLARKWLLSRSTHWPVVQGEVQMYSPVEKPALCLLSYSYTVNGEYYSGEIPVMKSRLLRTEDDVKLALPVGSSIDVKHKPGDPTVSVGVMPEMVLNGGFPVQV